MQLDREGNPPESLQQVLSVYDYLVDVRELPDDIASVLTLAERVNTMSKHLSAGNRRLREVLAKDGNWKSRR